MKRIATGSQVAAAPTFPADSGTPGYFADAGTTPSAAPTQLSPKWVTSVQEAVCLTILDSGAALSDTLSQFSDCVKGVHATKAHATDTGVVSTALSRGVFAAVAGRATGAASGVFAGGNSTASGAASGVFAGDTNNASSTNTACVGGASNAASASDATVIGGTSGTASAARAFVAGGNSGLASAVNAACVGGENPTASAAAAATLGGDNLIASGIEAVAVGGQTGTASGLDSATLGGNVVTASGTNSACVGGASNAASNTNAGVFGGLNSTASGAAAACVGGTGVASGAAAACVGGQGTASASYSATLGGLSVTASGRSSVVVGSENTTVSGAYSGAVAAYSSTCAGDKSGLLATDDCVMTSAADQSVLLGAKSCELIAPNVVAGGYAAGALTPSGANQNLTWRINSTAGTMILLSTLTQSGSPNADYAEMFPNASGAEIAPGTLLARAGRGVRPALPGERICGVVSAAPAILTGGTGELGWASKSVTDEWGRILYDEVDVLDADGAKRYSLTVPRTSPAYDPTRPNVPRTSRPDEWTAVALLGQIRVRIGPKIADGDMLGGGKDGVAVAVKDPKGRPVEVMEITKAYDPTLGYGVALCLVG